MDKEKLKNYIINNIPITTIQTENNISFRRIKSLCKKYNFLIYDINIIYKEFMKENNVPDICKKYIWYNIGVIKTLNNELTKEQFINLVEKYFSIRNLSIKTKSGMQVFYKLNKKFNKPTNIIINKEKLKELYINKEFNKKELTKYFNCTNYIIDKYLKKYNIVHILLENITDMYIKGYSNNEIINSCNITKDKLNFYYKHYSIKAKKTITNNIDKKEFINLYVNKRYTYEQLQKYYNCSHIVIINFIKKHNIKRDLKTYIFNTNTIKELYLNKNLTQYEIAEQYGCCQNTINRFLIENNIIKNNSYSYRETNIEKIISKFLNNNNIDFIKNSKKLISIKPIELDFYLIDYDIGIETNGLYWHSTKINKNKYHIFNKHNLCASQKLRLITIFEDELLYKQEIVETRLKNILNLNKNICGARQTIINDINNKIGIEFLNKYHIQGSGKNKIYLGAYFNDKLVSVMSFNKPSISKGSNLAEWELNRFASIGNIPGIASKLYKYFINKYQPETVVSYADKRWNTGNLYKILGFKQLEDTKPNYWYIKQNKRVHRFSYNKQKLLSIIPNADPNKAEEQLAESIGLYRIYDCGNYKFSWKNNDKNIT